MTQKQAQFFLATKLGLLSPLSLSLLLLFFSLISQSLRETYVQNKARKLARERERERGRPGEIDDHVVDELLEHGGGGAATGVPVPPQGRRAHLRLPRAQARRQGRVLRPPAAHGRRRSQQG